MAFPHTKLGILFRPAARPSLYLYLSLRALHIGASTLTLSYFCSLIGWHNAHYCSTRFYKSECSQAQQEHARVPTLYLVFVSMYCFSVLSAFGLSYRQLSWFFSFDLNNSPKDNSSDDAFLFSRRFRRALRSVPILALIVDSVVFIVLGLCLQAYWTSVIRPNHMHPGSGYKSPVCWLFERTPPTDANYWKNLKVEKLRCMDNQISFYGTIGVLAFTVLMLVVDAFYLHFDRSTKTVVNYDTVIDGLGKHHTPQALLVEEGTKPSCIQTA